MRKIQLLLILNWVFASAHVRGQITLTQNDWPVPGESWVEYRDNGAITNIANTPPGPNQVWNYITQWNIIDTLNYQWSLPAGLTGATNWPSASIGANLSYPSKPSITTLFCAKSPIGFFTTGLFAQNANVLTKATSNNLILPASLTYGDSITTYDAYVVENISLGAQFPATRQITHATRVINCDAWGMLYTPSQTANALRVKSLIKLEIDSFFIDNSGSGNNYVFDYTNSDSLFGAEYNFYKNGPGMILLQLFEASPPYISYSTYYGAATTELNEISSATQQIYPNPVQDQFTLQFERNSNYEIKLYNYAGSIIYFHEISGANSLTLSTSELSNGLYFLDVKDKFTQHNTISKLLVAH